MATYRLTVGELPLHSHAASLESAGAHSHSMSLYAYKGNRSESGNVGWGGDDVGGGPHTLWATTSGNHSHAITIGNTGSSTAYNNLQPYIVSILWRRTA